MIAETGVLSTSPWNSDSVLKDVPSDVLKSIFNTNDVLNFAYPLFDVETCDSLGNIKQEFSSSGSASSTSSDCSEEISMGVFLSASDDILYQPDHDYLNTSLNLLDDNSMAVSSTEFDWTVADNLIESGSFLTEDVNSEAPDAHILSSLKQKPNISVDPMMDTKLWSRMARNEQFEAVENLTNIISTEMGLREQLDIIRIIDPSAVISPTDTEFVIDLCALNDVKLCRVREYVKKVLASQEGSRNHRRSTTKPVSNSTREKCNSSASRVGKINARTIPVKSKNGKKKEKKEKRVSQKVVRQQKYEEPQRHTRCTEQSLKEKRSGFFEIETVITFNKDEYVEEVTDIDILE